jgi:hypothetical protein
MIGSACFTEDGDGVLAAENRPLGDHQRVMSGSSGVGGAKFARPLELC